MCDSFLATLINLSTVPTIVEAIKGSLNDVLEDFFDIFGNDYEPHRDIICPYDGKLFRRHDNGSLEAENLE